MRSWIGLFSLLPLTMSAAIYQSTDGNNRAVFSDQPSMHAKAVTLSAVATANLPAAAAPSPVPTPTTVTQAVPLNVQITTPTADTKVWLGGEPLVISATLSTLPLKTTAELRYDGRTLMTQAVTTAAVHFKLNYHTSGKHTVQIVIKQDSSRDVVATSQLINLYVLVHRPLLKEPPA
ncbi:MAG: DUF4124 domain-containing protein [Gammaproteobacteria bacterium]|nr:DUF4124 domain-containing protein [Gammaproteobacteria bacterium]